MFNDPDEGRILQILYGPIENPGLLLEYADFLHGRDDLRSEFLRLEDQLSDTDVVDPVSLARQTRYRELLRLLEPFDGWVQIVRRNDRIRNCGKATVQPPKFRFRFQCPNKWEALAPTPEEGVRYCEDCRRRVYFCDSAESVKQHTLDGNCIATPRTLMSSVYAESFDCFVGLVDIDVLWISKVFGRDA